MIGPYCYIKVNKNNLIRINNINNNPVSIGEDNLEDVYTPKNGGNQASKQIQKAIIKTTCVRDTPTSMNIIHA